MLIVELRALLRGVRDKPYQGRSGFTAHCPVCQASSPRSSSGHLIAFEGDDGIAHFKCTISECPEAEILNAIGLTKSGSSGKASPNSPAQVWDYIDQSGRYLFSKAKWINPKNFRQGVRQPDGRFEWNLNGVPRERPLYRLPELLDAISRDKTIHLCEGEKAVDQLYRAGHIATCQSDGAGKGKLRDHHIEVLARAAEVVIWADRDEPGISYALECSEKLARRGVKVQVVQSKTTGHHDDAFDHLEAGYEVDESLPLSVDPRGSKEIGTPSNAIWDGFLSVEDVLAESDEQPEWLWEELLPVGGVALFCAKPKVGKSTLLRHLAVSVSRGDEFLGRATKASRVLYLAIEENHQVVGSEIRRVGWTTEDQITLRFGSAPQGVHREIIESLQSVIREGCYGLLIVDTIGRLARVKQGNDYAEVTQALEPIVDLARQTGCAVILTHHLGKNDRDTGDGSLGSTAYFAAVDVCIDLKKLDGQRVLDSVSRTGSPFEGQVLAFDAETRRVSLGGKAAEIQSKGIERKIVDGLSSGSPLTRDEIKKLVGGNATRFGDAFRNALQSGRIVEVSGRGAKGSPKLYGLPNPNSGIGVEPELE